MLFSGCFKNFKSIAGVVKWLVLWRNEQALLKPRIMLQSGKNVGMYIKL